MQHVAVVDQHVRLERLVELRAQLARPRQVLLSAGQRCVRPADVGAGAGELRDRARAAEVVVVAV